MSSYHEKQKLPLLRDEGEGEGGFDYSQRVHIHGGDETEGEEFTGTAPFSWKKLWLFTGRAGVLDEHSVFGSGEPGGRADCSPAPLRGTPFDCFIFLFLENYGVRKLEALFAFLISVMALSFAWMFVQTKPSGVQLLLDKIIDLVCALCFEVKRFPIPYNKVMELGAVNTETSMSDIQLCPQDKSNYGGYSSLSTMTGASKLCSEDKLLEVQTLEDWREIQSAESSPLNSEVIIKKAVTFAVRTEKVVRLGANPFSSISFKSTFASSSLPLEQNPLISTLNVATFGCFPSLSILRLTAAAALGFPSWQ
nr:metal transporter Nramp3-like [Ipomoea batatas]